MSVTMKKATIPEHPSCPETFDILSYIIQIVVVDANKKGGIFEFSAVPDFRSLFSDVEFSPESFWTFYDLDIPHTCTFQYDAHNSNAILKEKAIIALQKTIFKLQYDTPVAHKYETHWKWHLKEHKFRVESGVFPFFKPVFWVDHVARHIHLRPLSDEYRKTHKEQLIERTVLMPVVINFKEVNNLEFILPDSQQRKRFLKEHCLAKFTMNLQLRAITNHPKYNGDQVPPKFSGPPVYDAMRHIYTQFLNAKKQHHIAYKQLLLEHTLIQFANDVIIDNEEDIKEVPLPFEYVSVRESPAAKSSSNIIDLAVPVEAVRRHSERLLTKNTSLIQVKPLIKVASEQEDKKRLAMQKSREEKKVTRSPYRPIQQKTLQNSTNKITGMKTTFFVTEKDIIEIQHSPPLDQDFLAGNPHPHPPLKKKCSPPLEVLPPVAAQKIFHSVGSDLPVQLFKYNPEMKEAYNPPGSQKGDVVEITSAFCTNYLENKRNGTLPAVHSKNSPVEKNHHPVEKNHTPVIVTSDEEEEEDDVSMLIEAMSKDMDDDLELMFSDLEHFEKERNQTVYLNNNNSGFKRLRKPLNSRSVLGKRKMN